MGIFPNNFASVTGNFLLDNRLDANVPDRRNILIILHFLFFYWTLWNIFLSGDKVLYWKLKDKQIHTQIENFI